VGIGTEFSITLPITWEGTSEYSGLLPYKNFPQEKSDRTILVVDDDPKIVKKICSYLAEAGYKTISANSGQKALKLAEEYKPYAITLDVIMPEMDGWEVLQRLKNNLKTKDIPVIIVSVSKERGTGFALGAIGFVGKPVGRNKLISEINKLHEEPGSIMIVDDNKLELKQIAEIIRNENIDPIMVSGGQECVKLLQKDIPDILVLDLMMPGMDGFQVLEAVRNDKRTHDLPVIIVSAKDLTREDRDRLKGNVSSILAKSESTSQELFHEIERILTELGKLNKRSIADPEKPIKRILIVEDNKDIIIQIQAIIRDEGYEVDFAANGQEALDYVKKTIPDGIILDLMMPGIDGFEVLETIRNTSQTRKIPVLILTAKDLTKNDLAKLSANNIQQLVQKGDVDIDEFLMKIKLMLENRTFEKLDVQMEIQQDPDETKDVGRVRVIEGTPRILIIEDNPDNMITINAIISPEYEVLKSVDGETGLKKFVDEKPDLVLLDISLPGMDGFEVIHQIRNSGMFNDIPVIAVTARAMKEDKEMIMAAGFDEYITKPVDRDLLLKAIKGFFRYESTE